MGLGDVSIMMPIFDGSLSFLFRTAGPETNFSVTTNYGNVYSGCYSICLLVLVTLIVVSGLTITVLYRVTTIIMQVW